ncbi:4,5-DOPA dioxygenase extradiol [Amphritea balenae]|uniref:4,5-DOPA dioxygenase extradiol n=1 Tax=Amphritea balenae TaxID=452629 RepID=A0A3P1ST94_9GAMM|nr:4,5-DOPA dioxygenase extradiol [Amphritea balenae]RRC99392.1 4,5-DOPA dioxygenase extradiol [Amphritea balenae]GGK71360.1 dioxygenase [Amphritea balenae]
MNRRDLLKAIMSIVAAKGIAGTALAAGRKMPVLFVGHGSPMNVLRDNGFTRHLNRLGESLPKPRAVLVVSAHWIDDKPALSSTEEPDTMYDFGGFPEALYEVNYPCQGDPALANHLAGNLKRYSSELDEHRGLDHGAWTVLHHLYPKANIPVIQLAMSRNFTVEEHLELGGALGQLRNEGVLILGSGNIVHNLRRLDRSAEAITPDWAEAFDRLIKNALLQRDFEQLLARDSSKHPLWQLSHPTIEHYVPLLYALGATTEDDEISFPYEGFDSGSISMRSVRFG